MLGGHPGASTLDDLLTLGRHSCIKLTFSGQHYERTRDSLIFGSPSLSIPLSSFKGWLISFFMFGDRLDTFCVCEKYGFYDEMSIKGDEFCGFEFSCLEILCWKVVLKDFVLVFA